MLNGFGDSAINPFTKTLIGECVAPIGTVAVKEVVVAEVTVALTPPNQTILFTIVELKFVPVIVTVVPTGPLVGERFVIVGCAKRIELKIKPDNVAVPPGVVTETDPDVPLPITAVILVALTTVNDVAAVPPKFTIVAPVKFVPVIVIVVPVTPLVGVKDVIVGTASGVILYSLVSHWA